MSTPSVETSQTVPPEKREAGLTASFGSAEHWARLWDAINEYAEACGATPGARIYGNTRRQRAVAEIEALLYPPRIQKGEEPCDGERS